MDREIKFRGKRISDGKWLNGSLITGLFGQSCNILDKYDDPQFDCFQDFDDMDTEVISSTVGQFTGLTDKNGKEIYEGDIVSCSHWHPSNYQMVFIEGAFCLGGKDGEWITDVTYMEDSKGKHFKVIGNIHQNPELL